MNPAATLPVHHPRRRRNSRHATPSAAGQERLPARVGRLEVQTGKLEVAVEKLQDDVQEIKVEVRELRHDVKAIRSTDIRQLYAAIIATAVSLAGLMAKGFGWF